jgi:predicted permease
LADALIGTAVPILLLMTIGFLSRKFGILKHGDERVLSAYVYFFALPALFIVDLAETTFEAKTLTFIFAGIMSVFIVVAVYGLFYLILRCARLKIWLAILEM